MDTLEKIWDAISDFFSALAKFIEGRITALFGSSNARFLKKIQPRVDAINKLESKYRAMSDEQLRSQTDILRLRLSDGETLDDILEDAFAVCREAGRRVLGLRHYDVQLIGGIVLHTGAIAEMMTGEGKTLVATLPAYLNALEGKGVHVVTVNDYLARRDMEWMGPLYMSLGLTVGSIQSHMSTLDRQKAYACDITYGTNNEFGFDYLRDNMRPARRGDDRYDPESQQSQGRLHYAIVDEVDNILIDEARTPLIISGPSEDDTSKYKAADAVARQLIKGEKDEKTGETTGDFIVDEKDHTTNLTDEGVLHAERLAGVESFYTTGNMHWPHLIDNALKAHYLYKKDVNYVIKNGEIIIVDEFTGRLMEGRSWSDGLHQAVEAKEGVTIKKENQTLATITLQNFFKLYDKLAGMTGTAMTEAGEFWKIYNLEVIAIPPNRPVQRIHHVDKIYRTEKEKYNAVVEAIERINKWDTIVLNTGEEYLGLIGKETDDKIEFTQRGDNRSQAIPSSSIMSIHRRGCPVLVGTVSIQKSELISQMLDRRGIKHQVLNAKPENVGRESEIIAQAGRLGAVTIATNMAGRGTDIILGGNPETLAWAYFQTKYPTRLDVPQAEWEAKVAEIEEREQMKAEGEVVRSLGGLHIIGTERHEARRIDLQLRGRCGRQGDPGDAQFYLSLEDDLVRIFAGDWVKNFLARLGMEEGMAIENKMVSRRVEGAQKKIEERNFDTRKSLLDYDEVMDMQRKSVYSYRQRILDGGNTRHYIEKMINGQIDKVLGRLLDNNYGAETFAAFASRQFNVEFEAKQFRGHDFKSADEYAHEYARRMAETQVLDAIEENLSTDVPESEWNWQALTKTVNFLWKCALRDIDLKKIGRDGVAQFLIDRAVKYIDGVDLTRGEQMLDPSFGIRSACQWVKLKFGLDLDVEQMRKFDTKAVVSEIRRRVFDKYREKELFFPIMATLMHFTHNDASGRHLDREGVTQWVNEHYGVSITEDDLKNKQREEIIDYLFTIAEKAAEPIQEDYKELEHRLSEVFSEESINIDRIQQFYDQKVARNERISPDERVTLKRGNTALQSLCDWLQERFHYEISPNEIRDWDILLIKNRLESVIEDRYNPEFRRVERQLILGVLDGAWKEHLLSMDHLKASVGFRGYAQVDPKVEYKREGMKIFEDMWNGVFERVTDYIFRVEQLDEKFINYVWTETEAHHETLSGSSVVDGIRQQQDAAVEMSKTHKVETIRNKTARVGRNEPCPCGSGKKYKNCCGKKA